MDETGVGLPASIELAWGLREQPTRGPKRGLSLQSIVAAGMRVAAADGIGAVSMSRVAAELGSATMALYRYVAAKDELLALMVDAALGDPPSAARDDGWRAGLTRWTTAARDAYLRSPWTLRVPITGPPATPNQIGWLEQGLRCMAGIGLTEQEKLSVILLLSGFVRNDVTLDLNITEAAEAAGLTPREATAGYGRMLARLTAPERFPALHRAIASGALDDDTGLDAEFTFGLERILDGLEALIRNVPSVEIHDHGRSGRKSGQDLP